MSFNTRYETLFTKRRFLQGNDKGRKIGCSIRTDEHSQAERSPRRLVQLIPLGGVDRSYSVGDSRFQSRDVSLERIAVALEQVANASEKYYASIGHLIDKKSTGKESRDTTSKENTNIYSAYQPVCSTACVEALASVRESLRVILNGQNSIGSRLDGIRKEQIENKQQLEESLRNAVDDFKTAILEKAIQNSMELERIKIKQENIYDDYNVLNVRLSRMEQLVSTLMQQSNGAEEMITIQKEGDSTKIEEISSSGDSVHSVLSVSSGPSAREHDGTMKESRKVSEAVIRRQLRNDKLNNVIEGNQRNTTRF